MDTVPREMRDMAEQVAKGERPNVSVRTILGWYYYRVRTRGVLRQISRDMASLQLGTIPHIDWTYLDGIVTFMPRENAIREDPRGYRDDVAEEELPIMERGIPRDVPLPEAEPIPVENTSIEATLRANIDPTYRIGRLEMANRRPVSIAPDAPTSEAVTIMLKHDFSQLPVMTGERSVKGVFSWRAYGSRRSLGQTCSYVRESMDDSHRVGLNDSIFHIVALMQDYDCVLVEDASGVITGIITPYDISVTFGQLGEPFLILGEIENHVRRLIEGRFTKEELTLARDPVDQSRQIESVTDMTFGEYVRLLENPDRWAKLELALDRRTFVKDLEEVRGIRNDVMHFDPEGIDYSELKKLRDFAGFLQRIQKLRRGP
jgi:predicted transcriptional regulator